jgi:ribosomal protein S27AE
MPARPKRSSRPSLSLVDGGRGAEASWRWFCGRCAARPVLDDDLAPARRVCAKCGFGLLLRAREDELPAAGAPYVVVDASLAVQALSDRAEIYLNIAEELAVNHHLTSFLVSADCSASGTAALVLALRLAARGDGPPTDAVVSRSDTFGERITARISHCGPPPAALVVLG